MAVVGRARACPQMRALPLHPPCLKHLTFPQRRVTLLLPKAPPQEQLRAKRSLVKTRGPVRCMEMVAVTHHLRYVESHKHSQFLSASPVPVAHVSSRLRELLDCGLKKCLAVELVRG